MRCALIAPILVVSAFAQGLSVSGRSNGKTATVTLTPGQVPVIFHVVAGAPYSGREHTESQGAHAGNSDVTTYRDARGRVRTERPVFPTMAFRLVEVSDPVANCLYVFDPAHRVAHRLPLLPNTSARRTPDPEPARTLPDGTVVTSEPLGTRTISGVPVTGTKTTSVHPAGSRVGTTTAEIWRSPDLGIVVYATNSSSGGSVSTQTILDLSTKEPDPALFQVPAGYRVVEETGTFTISLTL
jgi:hypothetical protein